MTRKARGAVVQWSEPGSAAATAVKYFPYQEADLFYEHGDVSFDTGARWVQQADGFFEIEAAPAPAAVKAKAVKRGSFVILYV